MRLVHRDLDPEDGAVGRLLTAGCLSPAGPLVGCSPRSVGLPELLVSVGHTCYIDGSGADGEVLTKITAGGTSVGSSATPPAP